MGLKFLQDIINLDSIQFVNSSGTNAGLINMDGNDLVISNSQGDVLLGDGSADVFIGDGTNNVDIRFEQSGSITADNASATLTIGGTGNLVVEEPTINNPTFSGAFNLGSKLTLSTSNGYILFDYEPAGDTGEYTTEVPLLKVDHNGVEKTILSRISENGGIQLGHDDSVLITAGDVGDEIKSNWGATNENVVIASEAGFTSYAFPNNSTTWSNRNEFRFYGGDATAANNGLYIGDGSNTQFIDLDRNISAASVTAGNIKAMGGGNLFVYDDDDDTKIHFFASSNSNEGFLQLSNGSNWGLLARGKGNDPRLGAYHGGYLSIWGFGSNTGDDHVDDDELARFDFANERLIVNGEISTGGNITTSSNSYIVSSRKFTARDANGTGLFADDAASGLSIADDGDATFTGDLTVNGVNYGAYHSVNEDQYYFDDYNGRRNLAFFYKNARADIIRYQPVDNFEYWNGSAWVADSSQESNVKKLLDGRQDTSWNVPSTYYKFRFTTQTTTSWPTMAMIWMQTSWSGSTWPGATMLVEEYDGSSWATIVTAEFTSANGVTHWGLSSKADSALHTGNGQNADTTRITVDFYGWTPSNGSYTTIPLQNLMITSNYAGTENTDYTNLLSHDKHLRLGDNRMFAFGDGDDLQIYHDGSNSIIDDAGTGNLKIRSNRLQLEKYTGETMAEFIADGSSSLYYDNNKKLETTSTGVDVTGDVTASGYYYADTHFQSTDSNATLSATGGGSVYLRPNGAFSTTGQLVVHDTTGNVDISGNLTINSTYPRIFLTDSNHNDDWSIINNDGNFGIYNDTDTSYALTIDGSNNVGIGTASPSSKLHVAGEITAEDQINFKNFGGSLLRFTKDSWTTAPTHDLIYQGWDTTIDDYIYLKAPGNTTTTHGVALIGDGVIALGRTDAETGAPELTSAAAPLDDNWLVLNSTGATFSSDVTIGPKSNATVSVSESGGADVKMRAGSVGRIGTYSDHNLVITQNGSDALTIDTNRDATFVGDVILSGTAPTLRIQDSRNLNNPDWDSVSLGNIEFYTSDTTSPGARVLAEIEAFSNNAAASGPNADLIFKTSAIADSSPQTRLTIGYDGTSTFAGNVTAGSNSLTAGSLDINGNADISGTAIISAQITTGYGVKFTGGATDFLLYNNAGENVIYMRDTTNGAMITRWHADKFEVDKNLDAKDGVDVTGNITVTGTVDGVDIAARDAVLTSTTTTANAALPKAGGAMTGQLAVNHNGGTLNLVGTDHTYIQWYPAGISGGRHAYTGFAGGGTDHFTIANETSGAHINLTTNSGTVNVTGNLSVTGTVDGRDVATDGTKLDTIATNADVTPSWVPSSDPSYLTAHPNISAASSVNNSGKTYIQDITLDSNGHVTGLVSDSLTGSDFIEPGSNATLNSLSCGSYTHDTDIAFVLDSDNNETASFIIKDGVGNSPFTLTEDGDLTITGKFVSTFASKTSPGAILVEDSGEIKKRTTTELKTDLSLNNVPNTDATNASNLASGTVPEARLATTTIAKGGTGATTAAGARTALGAAASSHTHAASDITSGTFDSNRVKQICTTHHNFFMNSTANPPTADFFVPFNNLNESSNPTNAQYYNRMVAPYDGRIVKVVLHTTAAIGTACQVLFWVATSSGTFAPSAAETVTGVDLNTANTSATATFSTTSTAQFSEGDVLGVSIIKSTTATANMQVTVVWEYTL